jgi:hypothetical protein
VGVTIVTIDAPVLAAGAVMSAVPLAAAEFAAVTFGA